MCDVRMARLPTDRATVLRHAGAGEGAEHLIWDALQIRGGSLGASVTSLAAARRLITLELTYAVGMATWHVALMLGSFAAKSPSGRESRSSPSSNRFEGLYLSVTSNPDAFAS